MVVKVCERPYTSFKWCPGKRMRHKTTIICQICAKLKNVCQTCLFDLDYGLPVEARDKILDIKDDLPRSDANREYYRQTVEQNVVDKDETALVGGMVGKARKEHALMERIARHGPQYNRNRPHVCSFWQKGECNRGDACPFRHEMPNEFETNFSQKAVRDRYYGVNDKFAASILDSVNKLPKLEPPKNCAITTLCVAGINVYVKESDLHHHFYQFGNIKNVHVVEKKNVAFITFETRRDAELAAESSFNKLIINDQKLRVMWAKTPKPNSNDSHLPIGDEPDADTMFSDLPGQPRLPSQNPNRLGSSRSSNFPNSNSTKK